MDLVADMFPADNALSDRAAAARLAGLRDALVNGDTSGLDERQRALADRIGQAAQKIESGTEIARISELMTLAQYGPASIGAAAADASGDAAAEPLAETLFVARFLVELVFAASAAPALVPGDILKEHQLDRADLPSPSAMPVFQALLTRAAETLDRAETSGTPVNSPPLRKMLNRHRLQTRRQIERLRDRDLASAGARLTGFDNLMISLKLLLRLRGAS